MADELIELFAERILAPVGEVAGTLSRRQRRELSGFLAMQGCGYSGGLMVVGRATNGWDTCAYPDQLEDPAFRGEFALEVQKSVEGNGRCPMAWVTEQWGATDCYNTKKSAFWRVIKQVIQRLMADANCKDWSSRLVWSNLYKVSPGEGGNPGTTLRNVQLCGCKELFQFELETYRPERLLLLTGWDWAKPFLCELSVDGESNKEFEDVKHVGGLTLTDGFKVRVVVARHPQGLRPEKCWVEEVLKAFDCCPVN